MGLELSSQEKKSAQAETAPRIPLEWRSAFVDSINAATIYRLSWRTHNGGAWIALGDERPIRVVEIVERNGQTVYAVESDDGHLSPAELADQAWLECFEVFATERAKRGGELSQIYARVEILDEKRNEIGHCQKRQRPEKTDGPATADQVWIDDLESEEDRRDRSLSREHRRERAQMSALLGQAWQTASDAIGMMAQAHAESMAERERILSEERERILELREGDVDDRRAEQLLGMLERLAGRVMHAQGVGVPKDPSGVDPLIGACRELEQSITPEQWDQLAAVHSEVFADLRGVLARASRHDADRPEIFAALQAVMMGVAAAAARNEIDPAQLPPILGPENLQRLDRLRGMLEPE